MSGMSIKKRLDALAATLCQECSLCELCGAPLDVWRHEEVFVIYEPLGRCRMCDRLLDEDGRPV